MFCIAVDINMIFIFALITLCFVAAEQSVTTTHFVTDFFKSRNDAIFHKLCWKPR